ncbi:MAG: heparinase II/III domain-containing protein [Ginsengibacter sp.]
MKDVWYSDVQLMASRTDNGLFVASHGGNNGESHNHNDVGDFMVYADGHPVIIDVGSGTYTARTFSKERYQLWFNTSAYHNLPTVNNTEQLEGGRFAATDVTYEKAKSSSQLTMDIANAYPLEAGIERWTRDVKLNKAKNDIEIKDRFELKNETNNLSQTFMTVCKTDISSPGKIIFYLPDERKVFLDYDAKTWKATKEKIELLTPEDQGLKESWNDRDIWRILLQLKKPFKKASVMYTIHK